MAGTRERAQRSAAIRQELLARQLRRLTTAPAGAERKPVDREAQHRLIV